MFLTQKKVLFLSTLNNSSRILTKEKGNKYTGNMSSTINEKGVF